MSHRPCFCGSCVLERSRLAHERLQREKAAALRIERGPCHTRLTLDGFEVGCELHAGHLGAHFGLRPIERPDGYTYAVRVGWVEPEPVEVLPDYDPHRRPPPTCCELHASGSAAPHCARIGGTA